MIVQHVSVSKIDVIFILIPGWIGCRCGLWIQNFSSEFYIRVISLAWTVDSPALLLLLCIINTADYFDRAQWGGGRQTKFCSETLRNEKIKSASRPLTINLM